MSEPPGYIYPYGPNYFSGHLRSFYLFPLFYQIRRRFAVFISLSYFTEEIEKHHFVNAEVLISAFYDLEKGTTPLPKAIIKLNERERQKEKEDRKRIEAEYSLPNAME
jgi:hypothetical protein